LPNLQLIYEIPIQEILFLFLYSKTHKVTVEADKDIGMSK